MDSVTELEDLRLQWAALAVEDLSLLPQAALIASIRHLAQELLDRTEGVDRQPVPSGAVIILTSAAEVARRDALLKRVQADLKHRNPRG